MELAARQQELDQKFENDFKDELNDPMAKNEEKASNLSKKADLLEKKRESIEKMEDGNAKQKSEQNFQKELDSFAKEADAFAEKASEILGEDIPKTDKQNMPGEKQKWSDIRDKFEKKGEEMRGEDAGQFDDMQQQMQDALAAAQKLRMKSTPSIGKMIRGSKGWMMLSHGSMPVVLLDDGTRVKAPKIARGPGHYHDFLTHCIDGSRGALDFVARGTAMQDALLMGNAAQVVPGTELVWDASKRAFSNSEEATRVLYPNYRDGWTLEGLNA